jgi:glycosyltransferase involved in cell wall biosynthesis
MQVNRVATDAHPAAIPVDERRKTCSAGAVEGLAVALLTAGRDRPYALGMAQALLAQGVHLDFIGSNEVSSPDLMNHPQARFLNLRGDQSVEASFLEKMLRVLKYYLKLVGYALVARPKIFHILWNNKFELIDRIGLMLFYRALGKRVFLTAHNVNAGTRDATDSWLNRASLRVQYRLSEHIFVHTERMKTELVDGFGVSRDRISVIPFGINNTVPTTALKTVEAKSRLGLSGREKAVLFFGNIAPYKGLEYLVKAFQVLVKEDPSYRLIVVGRPKGDLPYWQNLERELNSPALKGKVISRIEYIPDEDTELYFKAADVLILPYTHIFQSGVLFLGYSFGLPVIATDVGSLKEEIVEGKTGFVCRPKDPPDLCRQIRAFFADPLFVELEARRPWIRDFANQRYSWDKVARVTTTAYAQALTK